VLSLLWASISTPPVRTWGAGIPNIDNRKLDTTSYMRAFPCFSFLSLLLAISISFLLNLSSVLTSHSLSHLFHCRRGKPLLVLLLAFLKYINTEREGGRDHLCIYLNAGVQENREPIWSDGICNNKISINWYMATGTTSPVAYEWRLKKKLKLLCSYYSCLRSFMPRNCYTRM
jgi:hypothetical protein